MQQNLFTDAKWEYNKTFLQFHNTREQFWHPMEIDGVKKWCWFWLSDKHLARLDSVTGDYVFDACKVCGPVALPDKKDPTKFLYPVYIAQPRMKQCEIRYFAKKWDDWARLVQAEYTTAPEKPDLTLDELDRPLTKKEILEVTPLIWSTDILVFSDELPKGYVAICSEPR